MNLSTCNQANFRHSCCASAASLANRSDSSASFDTCSAPPSPLSSQLSAMPSSNLKSSSSVSSLEAWRLSNRGCRAGSCLSVCTAASYRWLSAFFACSSIFDAFSASSAPPLRLRLYSLLVHLRLRLLSLLVHLRLQAFHLGFHNLALLLHVSSLLTRQRGQLREASATRLLLQHTAAGGSQLHAWTEAALWI